MKNQKGFSLVELLVVVIIIAIIAAIAIPNLLASRRAANEASAINSLRTIHSAQVTYQAVSGGGTAFATNLPALGSLVDTILNASATPTKSGYGFTMAAGGTGNVNYCATAVPSSLNSTGDRSFSVATAGVVYEITGGTAPTCTAATGVISSGNPIGTPAPAPAPAPGP